MCFFSPLRLCITVNYWVTPLIINFVIKLCQKLISKLQASYILHTYSAFTICRQFRTVFYELVHLVSEAKIC